MTDGVGLSYEQQAWQQVSREIEDLLLRAIVEQPEGFNGKITVTLTLNCDASIVQDYRLAVERRRILERQTAGPRAGDERRKT